MKIYFDPSLSLISLSLISLGIYYLVRLFAKDYAWIVTLLCVLFLLTSAVNALLTEA